VVAGSPAWKLKLPSGAWYHQIGSVQNPSHADLVPQVMLSASGEKLLVVYSLPSFENPSKRFTVYIQPRRDEKDDRPVIGVLGSEALQLVAKRDLPGHRHPVIKNSAAAKAEPPFEFGATIIGCTDPAKRKKDWKEDWTPLPVDKRNDQKEQKDYFVFLDRLRRLPGQPITIRVKRKGGEQLSIRVPPAYHSTFGLRMQMGQITGVRETKYNWDQAKAPVVPEGKRPGDIIEQVEVTENNGKVIRFVFPSKKPSHPALPGQEIDPCQLSFHLRQWAQAKKDDKVVTLKVRRDKTEDPEEALG
jgi:hypothetical protein